mmetsp:Transcript_82746/g.231983  ORF Transcript_82746/g.231983 Transcript_82746/m.231983 type:complete len:212 (-) Transcript_82746:677-1312(-)
MLKFSSSFAWSRRYCAISTILVSTNPCCRQNRFNSGSLAISVGCSSETISHKMPAGPRPANRERSTAASVCPSRVNTPPSLDRNGKMCPGREKSVGLEFGSANKFTVLARSVALIPVVMPCSLVASTVTVNAVPFGSSLFTSIGGKFNSSIRLPSKAMQITPLEYRTIFAISSGVQASAAMMRSPSFSRFMSSTTTTIFPSRTAAIASSTD